MSYVGGSGAGGGYGGGLASLVSSLFGLGGGTGATGTPLSSIANSGSYASLTDPGLSNAIDSSTIQTALQQPSSSAPQQADPNQASAPTGPMLATALTNAQLGIPPVTTDPNDPTGGNQSPTIGGPNQPAPGQGAQPWGTPLPGSGGRTPPPGYRPISDAPPDTPGGQPPPQGGGQQAAPQGGGGGALPRMPQAQQGAGAVGNLGGAAGTPLPQLIAMMLQRMRQRGQIPPWARGPGGLTRPGYGVGAGRYPVPGRGRAPFSPQSQTRYVPRSMQQGSFAPPGLGGSRGPVPQGANYMQRLYRGEYPPTENAMRSIQTPAGPMKVNPLAAGDVQGFTRDLQQHGFPFEKPWGSYNRRRMRWSNNWSSHAWGTAFDINDSDGQMSPRARQWMQQNPGLFQQIMKRWNMSQPLPGKDPNHMEWTGPNPQPGQQVAGADGGYNAGNGGGYSRPPPGNDAPPWQQPGNTAPPPLPRARPAAADAPPPTPPETAPPATDPAAPDLSSMFAGADDTEEDDTAAA